MDLSPPQAWTQRAKCRNLGASPRADDRDMLFPSPRASRDILAAKQFCHGCPVAVACLADGGDDAHAVRAGLTGDERRHLKEGATVQSCASCELPFVPRPANQTRCTGCVARDSCPEDFKADILAMHRAGFSGEQICQHFGFSLHELRLASKRWRSPLMRRPVAECGTAAGAVRHRRQDEPVCTRCQHAETRRQAARRDQLVAA